MRTELVIVTGLSGAGRSTAARALENVGFYVVDNLPQTLLLEMAALAEEAGEAARRTAVVLDVRSLAFSTDLVGAVAQLRSSGYDPRLIFVEAADEALVRRFEGVRRTHPLQDSGRLLDGITAERKLLSDVRAEADVVIDTTLLNPNQLRHRIEQLFAPDRQTPDVTVLSFGFKYGLPADADLVVDMRFLPNPHWVPELRPHNGLDPDVRDYVLQQDGASDFLDRYADVVATLMPGYRREGKHHVTLAVGCTGGKHRSVASVEALVKRLQARGIGAHAVHRDVGRE